MYPASVWHRARRLRVRLLVSGRMYPASVWHRARRLRVRLLVGGRMYPASVWHRAHRLCVRLLVGSRMYPASVWHRARRVAACGVQPATPAARLRRAPGAPLPRPARACQPDAANQQRAQPYLLMHKT